MLVLKIMCLTAYSPADFIELCEWQFVFEFDIVDGILQFLFV